MRRTLLAGALLALIAALLVDHGGSELTHAAVLGVSLGAVVGLVPDRSPLWRLGGFGLGFLLGWVGFLLRAGFLPDIPLGHAIAVAVVIGLVAAAAALSGERLPLWAALVGVAAMVGSYELTFAADPTTVTTDSVTAAAAVLFAAAFGFVATTFITELTAAESPSATELPSAERHVSGRPVGLPEQRDSGIDIVQPMTKEG